MSTAAGTQADSVMAMPTTVSPKSGYQQSDGVKVNALRYAHSASMPMSYAISAVEYTPASPSRKAQRRRTRALRIVECGAGHLSVQYLQ